MARIKQTIAVKIECLKFDPENPRIPSSVNRNDQDAVINWMLKKANLIELMGSIAEKGFFPAEPLLVIPTEQNDGTYYVIEGNRRFAALFLLNDFVNVKFKKGSVDELVQVANDYDHDLKNIPVLIYDERKEIEEYLGYRHITGVKAWSSMAKAKYLKKLQESVSHLDRNEQYKSLARTIGSKSNHVRLLLVGLEVAEKIDEYNYYLIKNLDDTTLDFGVLYTALAKANIAEYVGVDLRSSNPTKDLDPERLGELTEWMFEKKGNDKKTRLGESRNLSELDEVIGSEKALIEFKNGLSLKESLKLSVDPYQVFKSSLENSEMELKRANSIIDIIEDIEISSNFKTIKDIKEVLGEIEAGLKKKL